MSRTVLAVMVLGLLFSLCGVSLAAPHPRGNVNRVTGKILSVDENSRALALDVQKNRKVFRISADIELVEVGPMVQFGEHPELTQERDRYEIGQKLEDVLVEIEENGRLEKGMVVKGKIYSHGDEHGEWYVLETEGT